jgi:hypothetical protein
MKILCLGRKGDSRSAVLAWILKQLGHDAIAVGMRCMGKDTRIMLLDWADLILLLHEKCGEGVAQEYWGKLKVWPIGKDVYFKPPDQALIDILEVHMRRDGLWPQDNSVS